MRALIFDTETTGLISNRTVRLDRQPHIIEFYGCIADLKTGNIEQELDTLIKPPVEISAEITKITTITNDMVRDCLPFAAHAANIKALIESSPLAIAHNMAFDREMVDIEMERAGLAVTWPLTLFCTTEQTVHFKGFRLKLSMLHEHLFNAPFAGAHRAKVDVAALLRCCVKLHEQGDI